MCTKYITSVDAGASLGASLRELAEAAVHSSNQIPQRRIVMSAVMQKQSEDVHLRSTCPVGFQSACIP